MIGQQAEQNRRLAQRRRADWLALHERIESLRPRSEDERLAQHEALCLLRLAESDPVRTVMHG